MSTVEQLEQRAADLEKTVAELRGNGGTPSANQMAAEPGSQLLVHPVDPDWIDSVKGCMKDEPDFAEIVRLGREFRESQGFAEDNSP